MIYFFVARGGRGPVAPSTCPGAL